MRVPKGRRSAQHPDWQSFRVQSIRNGDARWRAIFKTIPDGILIANDKGRYVDANPAACKLFGMSRARIVARGIDDFADPKRKGEVRSNWRRFLREGHQRGLFRIYRPDGTTRHVDYIASAHVIPKQHLCILRDITERNQAERSLREREDRLRLEITERKKVERALRSAKDTAEAATHAKSQFIANISHEIRTPINGILGILELLQQTELNSGQKEYAAIMDDSGRTLMALINQLLDFSRMEAGKLRLDIKYFDLVATLDAVRTLFSQRVRFKRIDLISQLEGDIPTRLRGDPVRLRQVLMNLIGNALKFTERGKVTLRVTKIKETDTEVILRFNIQDTGPGISKGQKRFLFKPFSQLDNSPKRPHSGTGLGLAISKQLVDQMAGSIGMRSTAGQGSTFWFTLPFDYHPHSPRTTEKEAVVSPAETLRPPRSHDPGIRSEITGADRLRLLVVEDNRINRLVVVRQLEKLGCAADTVSNGREAVDVLREKDYDLVFMDCQMPVMDGYQATRAIRKQEKGHHTPIVAMTAHAMEEDRQICLACGMDDYISKPVGLERLRALLNERFGQRMPREQVVAPPPVDFKATERENLLRLYIQDTSDQLQELERALERGSARTVAAVAHTALGASLVFGLKAVADPLRQLEQIGQSANLESAPQYLQQAKEALTQAAGNVPQMAKEILC